MAEYKDDLEKKQTEVDVRQSLSAIRQALETYLDSPKEKKRLAISQDRLHEVLSPLKQLKPVTTRRLAEEILETASALINNQTTNAQFATETLIQGITQLSNLIGKPASPPEALIELLNALRTARHQPPLSALDLFDPVIRNSIPPLEKEQLDHLIKSGAIKVFKKIRQKYQICLTSYLRKKEPEQSLSLMNKLFGKLQNLTWGSPSSVLWDASAALVQGLMEQSIPSSDKGNSLLKALDFQLKQLIESNGLEVNYPPSPSLLKDVLYLISGADSTNKLILAQKKRYQLEQVFTGIPGVESRKQPSSKSPKNISQKHTATPSDKAPFVLKELHKLSILEAQTELNHTRNAIDDFLSHQRNIEFLSNVPTLLESVRDTLNITLLTKYASLADKVAQYIRGSWLESRKRPPEHVLTRISHCLNAIDNSLKRLYKGNAQAAEHSFDQASTLADQLVSSEIEANSRSLESMAFEDLEVIVEEEPEILPTPKSEISTEQASNKKELTFQFSAQDHANNNPVIQADKNKTTETSELKEIARTAPFEETAHFIHNELKSSIVIWQGQRDHPDTQKIIRDWFYTLKEQARTSDANVIGELASAVENMLNRLLSGAIKPGDSMLSLVTHVTHMLPDLIGDYCSDSQLLTAEVLLFMEQADDLARGEAFFAPEELASLESLEDVPEEVHQAQPEAKVSKPVPIPSGLLQSGELDVLLDADTYLERWSISIASRELQLFKKELKILGEKASEANIAPLSLLCNVLLDVCNYLGNHESTLPKALAHPLHKGFDALVNILNQAAARQTIDSVDSVFSSIRDALKSLLKQKTEPSLKSTGDIELIRLFLEEAQEITDNCSTALNSWLRQGNGSQALGELQRNLHTLKGGARMVGFNGLADISHAIESVYETITAGYRSPSEAPLGLLQKSHDHIEIMLQAISRGLPCPPAQNFISLLEQWCEGPDSLQKPESNPNIDLPDYLGKPSSLTALSDQFIQGQEPSHTNDEVPLAVSQKDGIQFLPSTGISAFSKEKVRVSQELLEQLITLSGESNVHRSQVEQQIHNIAHALGEMDSTTLRLKEQLRRLDMETHGQILSRHQQKADENPEFDPLEMDQYSELTQLSSALSESASDLIDLGQSIQDQNNNASTLLQQQARALTQLQKQLSETPMVPFERLLPRIRKTTDQVSGELNKPVELHINSAESKIDRTTLEKIQAPLEHIIRNAINHGIENSIDDRIKAGKPEAGQITLKFFNTSTHSILEVSDDGQGIDLNAVREKAIEKGIIAKDAQLAHSELLRLILAPGLSTANKITQMSGRGVGLDVVSSEISELGGNIKITSQPGQGTGFSIHLPIRSPIGRALLVQQSDRLYAIPMQSIDGLAMVSPTELLACYKEEKGLEYAGIKHRLISFNRLLGNRTTRVKTEHGPVIILQRGGENFALHIDAIYGGREIITQPLGPQFEELSGVNGATILADGSVVIVIEPLALIKKHYSPLAKTDAGELVSEDTNKTNTSTILIVDDSITMRKVTSRLLARNGYEVSSAKDGTDALRIISEKKPDLVLLDIEMPKMDGFEVASAIRNDPSCKTLPIIMVTSRTGEKHKDRAFSLGVNDYVGKPFQENILLETVKKHLSKAGS
ncbi:response regulator [Endozoicomonas sp. Mp262]|uniref:response regulator n=1 Tax=Endozoicomonas sp. Mp262 TaxID=2919499 RepID=UPI0021D99E2B